MLNWLRQRKNPAPDLAAALHRGFAALNAGELDSAVAALETVLSADPRHPDGNYLMGLAALRKGDPVGALAHLDAAVASDGTNASYHFSRGECLRPLGRLREAAAAFEAALARDGREALWWHELGCTRQALDQHEGALDAYREALARDPGLVPALCNLGTVLAETGDREAAGKAYREAMQRAPDFAAGALGLGVLLQADGDLVGAEASYRAALAAAPDQPEALINLGAILLEKKELEEAESMLRHAVRVRPDSAEAWINLGSLLCITGRNAEALDAHACAAHLAPQFPAALLQHALSLQRNGDLSAAEARLHELCALAPEDFIAHETLANVLAAQGALDDAELEFRRCLELRPTAPAALINYALLLDRTGRGAEAIATLERALEVEPDAPAAHVNLGLVLARQRRASESEGCFMRALELKPDLLEAHLGLQALFYTTGNAGASEMACRRGLDLHPGSGESFMNLGNALLQQGRLDEALEAMRRAVELMPDPRQARSNLLLTLNYRAESSPQVLLDEHRRFGAAFPPRRERDSFTRDRDPHRRLRVGYLSADFREHVVSFFVEPVFEAHNPRVVEIAAYYNGVHVDEYTRRIRGHTVLWREVANLDDDRLEQLMLEDRLDILVDLSGHTSQTRLPAASRRVAPVQSTWLGYPNTTGLSAFDWRITDRHADPGPEAEAQHVERLWRLPETFLTYRPPAEAPALTPLPFLERGYMTFGAFNNYAKVTDMVIELWARILREVPDSVLHMKTIALRDAGVRDQALRRLTAMGVDCTRVHVSPIVPGRREHLASIAALDLQLDTYPYHGTTTTCESLWMGVPVVSLAGDRHASRVGASLLQSVGASELVAHDPDSYVAVAVGLSKDPSRLSALRAGLRPAMQRSPLTDAARFTRQLEEAYRGMWHDWLSATG